jgi:predicted membrane chloride channel (bestrophin family)
LLTLPLFLKLGRIEKVAILRLTVAFAISTTHFLRGELRRDYEDLEELLQPNLKRIRSSILNISPPDKFSRQSSMASRLKVLDYGKKKKLVEGTSLLSNMVSSETDDEALMSEATFENNSVANRLTCEVNPYIPVIPLEITHILSSYMVHLANMGLIDASHAAATTGWVTSLNDALAGLERILQTPAPKAYRIHLKQVA